MLRRADLVEQGRHAVERFLSNPGATDSVVMQSSGGSTADLLVVPRTLKDIADTFTRVSRHFVDRVGRPPERVAMLGGIAHAAVAARWQLPGSRVAFFTLGALDELLRFDPDAVSCYPSVARELAAAALTLPALRAIKLGGERVHPADIERLTRRFPGLPVIEQYGSTEMPAVAVRVHERGRFCAAFALERDRFNVAVAPGDGWRDLIVRDTFPNSPFCLDEDYDTGDEVLVRDGAIVDVRRRHDPANAFHAVIDHLLRLGCTNVQFELTGRVLAYIGDVELSSTIEAAGLTFETVRRPALGRLPGSGKLPPILP